MTEYHATQEDMQTYANLLRDLAVLDIQRNQVIARLSEWEQAHAIPDEPAPDAEQPVE